mgnify:CR=1 FL=1
MKKHLGILLLLVYVNSTTEFYQLLKTPLLIVHYWEHLAEGEPMGVWNFMSMHYFNGDLRDEDYERDMQLPFKTFIFQPDIGVSLPVPPLTFNIRTLGLIAEGNSVFGYLQPRRQTYAASIWQPPRVV